MDGPPDPSVESPQGQVRTFLIADVRGYTLFTQERGDEAAAKLAARFADIARETVEARGGTLLELRGDEALCVFSSSREAIRAAVDLQQRFVQETIDRPELPLTVGVGLDAGEAIPVQGGYRGGALNLAARLCGQARAGEILASREVTHLARRLDGIRYEDRGSLTFKGITDPVVVVRVLPEDGDPADLLRPYARSAPAPEPARRRWIVPVAAGLALALGVAVAIPLLGGDTPSVAVGSDSVARIDADDGSVGLASAIGGRPGAIAIAFGSAWVLQPDRGRLVRLDLADGSVRDTIAVGGSPSAIAPGDDEMWVANAGDGTVSRVDEEANEVTQTLAAGSRPTAIATGDGALWVADASAAAVLRIDPGAPSEPVSYELPGEPSGLAWTEQGLWVAYGPDAIARLDPADGTIAHTGTVGTEPVAIASAHGAIWVANHLDGTVSRVDPSTGAVEDLIPVGDGPNALAPAVDGLWVTTEYDGTAVEIDPATNQVVRTVALAATASSIAADGEGALWVAVGASQREHRGGTLRIAGAALPSIDPATVYDVAAWQILTITNDGLLAYKRVGGPDGTTLVPDLASAFPEVSADGLVYRFPLRTGIRYATGDPVRPEDFRHGLERTIGIGADPSELYRAIGGWSECTAAGPDCDLSDSIRVEGSSLTIELDHPDPDLPYKLAMPFAYPVPTTVPIEEQGLEPVPATGPYMVAEAGEEGIELVRNPEFEQWSGAAQPDGFADAISVRVATGAEDAFGAVVSGEIDWTTEATSEQIATLGASSPDQVIAAPDSSVYLVGFDVRQPPFDDVRVRQAVNLAIDRERVVELFGGPSLHRPTCQLVPPSIPGHQPYCPSTVGGDGERWSGPDLARARELIEAAGVAREPVTVYVPGAGVPSGAEDVMAHVADVLNELGMRAELEVVDDVDAYFGELLYGTPAGTARHPQIFFTGWLPDFPTASNYVEPQFACEGFANTFGVCDRGLERLIDEARSSSLGDANRAWAAADRRLVDQALLAPLTNGVVVHPVSERVGNAQVHPIWSLLLSRIWVR